ncbi:MAG: phospho-sugar mutase, partial [Verrucomicrobia bacterium]|nr:phospho-sugar mutase [Verrucomicrobiota bacterium]
MACLCLDHLCSSHPLPKNGACIKTIVTTEFFAAIAKSYVVTCFNVLTGFKYIGALMEEWAHSGDYTFIFGGEESYGFLAGTHARDKDAVSMSGVIAELALELKLQGKTLIDRLLELYKEHGIYREGLTSIVYEGKTGAERIHSIMNQLRNSPLKKVGGIGVQRQEDYLKGLKHLPPADVLIYWLEDDSRIIIRPSGTEPKIKVYGAVVERHGTLANADDRLKALLQSFKQTIAT